MNENKILEAIEQSIIRSLHKDELFTIPYKSKIDISDFYKKIYCKIDPDKLYEKIKDSLEEHIAKKIVDKIVTEMSTDIKK